jgi:hypothetical protein
MRQSTRDSTGKPTKGDNYIDPVAAARKLQNASIEARQMPAEKLQNTIREFQEQNKAFLYKADLPDEKIARNSKKGYDGDPRWLPVTKHDLDTRLILGEEVMHWGIGEDSLGNEAWFSGEEKIMLFVRGGILEVFQPENNYAHGLLCLEQCGHDYSIKKQNKEYVVSIANKWHGNHSVREKAVVNALLCMVGKECYYGSSDKREVVREVIKEVVHEPEVVEAVRLGGNGSLKGISLPFSRR